jgi:hypothetical protein
MNKALILLLALVTISVAQKVKVDFYYESLCPYCQQFIEKSLKQAASTKVLSSLFRISGKYATSIFIHMEMPRESKMEEPGASLVNMALENVKETLLKLALLNYTIFILKLSHSLSALKPILQTGLNQDQNVHLNLVLIGPRLTLALQELKEINGKPKWELPLINSTLPILMFHGLSSTELTHPALNHPFFQTWLNTYAQFIKALKKLMPANDFSIQLLSFIFCIIFNQIL